MTFVCTAVSKFDPAKTFAVVSVAVKVVAKAANAAGVSVQNIIAKTTVTEVTFLNFSRIELFIRKR